MVIKWEGRAEPLLRCDAKLSLFPTKKKKKRKKKPEILYVALLE
jgi:hypothetical protein